MFNKKSKKAVTEKTVTDKIVTEAQTIYNHPDRLLTICQWPQFHPWPPIGGMRHIRFYADEKGATNCFVKKGGRVLVRERKFLEWAASTDAT